MAEIVLLIVGALIAYAIVWSVAKERKREKAAAAAVEKAKRAHVDLKFEIMARARREAQDFFFKPGFSHQAECMVNGRTAKIMAADDRSAIRLVSYSLDQSGFRIIEDLRLTSRDIQAAEVMVPTVREEVYRDQTVPVFTSKKKSKLARAVVGGLVAGPVGAVVGAATGIGHKIEAHNVTERVFSHHAERKGSPFLAVTTSAGRVIEVHLGAQSLHERWLDEIDKVLGGG